MKKKCGSKFGLFSILDTSKYSSFHKKLWSEKSSRGSEALLYDWTASTRSRGEPWSKPINISMHYTQTFVRITNSAGMPLAQSLYSRCNVFIDPDK